VQGYGGMTNFTNDEVLHNNLDKVVDELLDKPLTPTQRKKVLHLSDEGHFYIDKLEDVSSQLCNKITKYNGGNDDCNE
jgi:alpha/beta superfamily hydrolase